MDVLNALLRLFYPATRGRILPPGRGSISRDGTNPENCSCVMVEHHKHLQAISTSVDSYANLYFTPILDGRHQKVKVSD
jgi:hypothetical protein